MTNSTPSFLAVDSSMYTELVRRLGIDQMLPSRSRLALLDSVDESYYVMKGDYNKTNIGKLNTSGCLLSASAEDQVTGCVYVADNIYYYQKTK